MHRFDLEPRQECDELQRDEVVIQPLFNPTPAGGVRKKFDR
jgi:hypothetical protein